jgi:hypothetical protein
MAVDGAPLSNPCAVSESLALADENMDWPASRTDFLLALLLWATLALDLEVDPGEDLSLLFLCCGLLLDMDAGL